MMMCFELQSFHDVMICVGECLQLYSLSKTICLYMYSAHLVKRTDSNVPGTFSYAILR